MPLDSLGAVFCRALRAPPPPPRLAHDAEPEALHRVLSDLLAYEHWWEATSPVEDEDVAEDAGTDWHEEDHPRQDDGKFGKGGGGAPKAAKEGGKGRASVGGEIGRNGYNYKGGQFLPSTDAPPGTWRVKFGKGRPKLLSAKRELVAPGQFDYSPTPFSRSIFTLMRNIVEPDDDGKLKLIDNPLAVENLRTITPGIGGKLGDVSYDVEELIDLYNRGARWLDVEPKDVEILGKGESAGQAEAPPAPKLPEIGKSPEGRERYKKIKELAGKIDDINSFSWKQEIKEATLQHIKMADLQRALNALWEDRMHESGKLSKPDQKLNDTLQGEVRRRFTADHDEREKRADEFAYMSDEEISEQFDQSGFFSGNSRMKPGMKAQLGRLPQAHVRGLVRNSMKVRAVTEIPAMSMDHPYAPGMIPAGVFFRGTGEITVGDQVTLPNGEVRIIGQRAAVLRHEVGHAIDDITELSSHIDVARAFDNAVAKMTPKERSAAAYWVGDTDRAGTELRTRRSEMFAETYAYAYSEGDPYAQYFGGLSSSRLFELLGPARRLIREKLAAFFGDWRLD